MSKFEPGFWFKYKQVYNKLWKCPSTLYYLRYYTVVGYTRINTYLRCTRTPYPFHHLTYSSSFWTDRFTTDLMAVLFGQLFKRNRSLLCVISCHWPAITSLPPRHRVFFVIFTLFADYFKYWYTYFNLLIYFFEV